MTKKETWVELKRLFEPDTNDELWKLQKHIHDLTWKLYDSCRVHYVSTEKGIDIYMLVEKEYPFSRGTLTLMLVAKLLVDQDNKMSKELLRKIFMKCCQAKILSMTTFNSQQEGTSSESPDTNGTQSDVAVFAKMDFLQISLTKSCSCCKIHKVRQQQEDCLILSDGLYIIKPDNTPTSPSTAPVKPFPTTVLSHSSNLHLWHARLEPTSYTQASKHPKWVEAINNEIYALESNHTWELTTLPPFKHPIRYKWVYRIKYNANRYVDKYKVGLVAKGFNQNKGIDYTKTFAPVGKMVTVRIVLSISSINNWFVHQLDIKNAFLYGDLNEEVYMAVPSGYKKSLPPNIVCRLKKSLYRLKQANR
ncbi:retrovirus-related pol polyprotein from transposon TNT 1-94 [Tanacetum coccineum]